MDKTDNFEETGNRGIEEEKKINLMEFELDSEQIEEFIDKLNELKDCKESVDFTIDEDNDLLIHYSEFVGEENE